MPTYDIVSIQKGLPKIVAKKDIKKPVPSFFSTVVFGGTPIYGTKGSQNIEFDYRRIANNLPSEAVFGADPNRVSYETGFDITSFKPAYFNEKDIVTWEDAEDRYFGEEYVTEVDPDTRMLHVSAEKRDRMYRSFDLAKEKFAGEAALNGFVTTKRGKQTFPMTANLLKLAGANLLSDPIKTLATVATTLKKHNLNASIGALVFNLNDSVNFVKALKNEGLFEKDNLHLATQQFGAILETGVTYVTSFDVMGAGTINVLCYEATADGTNPLIPQGKAVVLPKGLEIGSMAYGRVLAPNNSGLSAPIVTPLRTDVYATGDSASNMALAIQCQSSPLPIITEIDGYGVITGIPATLA